MMRPKLRIAVLAAGFSTRLGAPKPLARVHGLSLIKRTIRALAPLAASPIIVVLAPRAMRTLAELRGERITIVANFERAMGLSSSVRRALVRARYSSAVLLVPVDLVHLGRRDLERLITRWNGARRRVVATRFGSRGGAPLILPRWLYSRALGIEGDHGLKKLVSQLPDTERVLVHIPTAAWDVDTPRDLERARSQARPRRSR
jgi:molybdenum cofactor cytidylyltransferase